MIIHENDRTIDMHPQPLFDNPFCIEDILVFDDATLQRIIVQEGFGITLEQLAHSLHNAPRVVSKRVKNCVPLSRRLVFQHELAHPLSEEQVVQARKHVLDSLFWELIYWKTPALYEELIEGEALHPGIFLQLSAALRNKTVLDVGAGSGRATFECLRHGATLVHAVEPSPGLLRILKQKKTQHATMQRVIPHEGRFDAVPLPDDSVDVALSCSAFTALPEQGGEGGLMELERVTKRGGKIIIIWPRVEDHGWLEEHGFRYVALPVRREMSIHFRSLQTAVECARLFYARNKAVLRYVRKRKKSDVPFSIIGVNPPCDYYWRVVEK